jgi:hypothetical protein
MALKMAVRQYWRCVQQARTPKSGADGRLGIFDVHDDGRIS